MTESIPRSGPRSSSRRRPPVLGAQAKQSTYALIPPGMYLSQSLPSSATASSRWSATRSATTSAHGALRARIRCICRRRRCSTGAVRSDPRLCWHGTSLRWIGRSSSRYAETPVSSTGPKRQHPLCGDRLQLVSYLGRDQHFDAGCILLTGTGIVPPSDFSLQEYDEVTIRIDGIGTLNNPVRRHVSSGQVS